MKAEIFKERDRVFCTIYGWGIVIRNESNSFYSVYVEFDNSSRTKFTYDGRILKESNPTLSFTEYTLQGFSQERPAVLPEVGELCLVRDKDNHSWSVRKFVSYIPNAEFPYVTEDDVPYTQIKRIKIL